MEVYRMKHIPTGLFYTPSRGSGNLSKTGKFYVKKPDLGWGLTLRIKINSFRDKPAGHHKIIIDYFRLNWGNGTIDTKVSTRLEDWIIETVE